MVADGYPPWGPPSKIEDVEQTLPSEILDALTEAERQNVAELAVEQSSGFVRMDHPISPVQQPALPGSIDLGHVALVGARRELLGKIVDNLVRGAQFVAVTGEPGAEKTVIAAEIREELSKRSVSVRSVDGRGVVPSRYGRSCPRFSTNPKLTSAPTISSSCSTP
jgi:hypothetical protein